MHDEFDSLTEKALRRRQSAKWSVYPDDVLPAWVAEMDFPLAEPIREVLHAAVDESDCGYASARGLGEAFAGWAAREWRWTVDAKALFLVPDVVTGLEALLRVMTKPGDSVVIDPPVYPPFAGTIRAMALRVADAPLVRANEASTDSYVVDLDALERLYAGGAKVHVLCSPHNPTGFVYSQADLAAIAERAERHGVMIVSDEIHAPLTLPGATHVPFPMASEAAARRSLVLGSASKTWNLAGLKAAFVVAGGPEGKAILAKLPQEMPYHAGHFGVLAARAAFEHGEPWRKRVIALLDRNRRLLTTLLAQNVPAIRYVPPRAGYLAWLDCRALGLGDDPSRVFLERGRVALSSGPTFGAEGKGFARLNFATSRGLLEEAVQRIAKAVSG